MKRVLTALGSAVLVVIAGITLAGLVRSAGSAPAATDSGTITCRTNSNGYCPWVVLPWTPDAVVVDVQAPTNVAEHATQLNVTGFQPRFRNSNGANWANQSVTYSYIATEAPAPPPVSSSAPPPPPPTSPPPPPPGTFAPGEALNGTNTGYAADPGGPPTKPSGSVTYSASGTATSPLVFAGFAYSGEVDVEGDYITIQDCSLTNGGLNAIGFLLNGNHDTVKNCTITSPAGQSMYEPIWVFGDGNTVDGVNISRGENALTTYGTHVTIQNSWLHEAALDSQPSDHPDSIEVYGGGTVSILNNKIVEDSGPGMSGPGMFDSPINVAPYNSYKVQGLTIKGNFLDNGQGDTLIDNQNTSCAGATGDCLINVIVEDNAFGGHQCPSSNPDCIGIFTDLENYEHRPDLQTPADLAANPNGLLWPTSGPDVNRWEESADIETSSTPHDGDIVVPSPN